MDVHDKDLSAVGETFKHIHGHMKVTDQPQYELLVLLLRGLTYSARSLPLQTSFPVWEDFVQRGHRFQKQLE